MPVSTKHICFNDFFIYAVLPDTRDETDAPQWADSWHKIVFFDVLKSHKLSLNKVRNNIKI